MRVRARTIILALVGLVIILFVAAVSAVGWQVVLGPRQRAVTDRKFAASEARLARGKYLTESVAACFHCHSEHDLSTPSYPLVEGKKGAGWLMPIPELGRLIAPNITSDPETGIGAWTDDEIARAIQEGISRNGRALFPVMPYMNFRNLDEEDLASIVVYLRTLPPVKTPTLGLTALPFPLSFIVKTIPQPLTSHETPAPRTTPEERGKYLTRTVAGCHDCHSPADERGAMLAGMEFGGGGMFKDPGNNLKPLFSMNITQDPSGIAHYDESLFIQTMQSGQQMGRMISHIMPFEAFRTMTPEDLADIWAYLKSVPHVKHRVNNSDPPTPCPVCGQTHGLGDTNTAPAR
jgi:mono/diheme cytochrome c family protein